MQNKIGWKLIPKWVKKTVLGLYEHGGVFFFYFNSWFIGHLPARIKQHIIIHLCTLRWQNTICLPNWSVLLKYPTKVFPSLKTTTNFSENELKIYSIILYKKNIYITMHYDSQCATEQMRVHCSTTLTSSLVNVD